MKCMFLAGLVAAFVAVSFAELCTPDQWEGIEVSVGGYLYHRRPGFIKENSFVSYDAANKRKASFIHYVNNDYENKFQIIVRYGDDNDDSGKVYVVDEKKNKCWTKKLREPFRKACLPDDAKKIDHYSLGLKGAGGLEVTGYAVKKREMGVYVAVSKSGKYAIPVTERVHGHFMKTVFSQGMEFCDITPGIKNETVFDIPAQCKEEEEMSVSEYLMRENFVLGI